MAAPLNLRELSVSRAQQLLFSRQLSCAQLVEHYLARIARFDQAGAALNAVIRLMPAALAEAAALDEELQRAAHDTSALRARRPLFGIPVLLKDQAETAGVETSFGSVDAAAYVPETDATCVVRLRAAGAIILAKTTMPPWACSFFSLGNLTGPTRNPYDGARDSGGSSSGSAAGCAADFAVLAVAEDTGGSVRLPAAWCGLVGLRPTPGLISGAGCSPLLPGQDTLGPMARTVLDAAHLLDALVGFDPKDVLSSTNVLAPRPEGGYASALSKHSQLRGLRFGVLTQCFGDESEAEGSASNATARAALSKLQDAGIELVEVSVEQLWEQVAFTSLYVQEGRQSLERFFASRPALGFTDVASLHVDPAVELLKLLQTKAPALASEDKKFGERLRAKELFQRRMLSLYAQEKLDAFIYPSAKTPAPLRSDIESGRYAFDGIPTNTVIASQLCWPAITLPAGLTSSDGQLGGLPVGLELMTPPYSDARLLSLAHGVEQATQARVPPPGLD